MRWLALILTVSFPPVTGLAQIVEWVQPAGGIVGDVGTSIAVDADRHVFVTGRFGHTATFGPFELTRVGVGEADIFVAKLDVAGNWVWVNSTGAEAKDSGMGIALDSEGNSYVTGNFERTVTFGSIQFTSINRSSDIFVAKYDSNGTVLWAIAAGAASGDVGRSIAVDNAGNSYVTGQYRLSVTFGESTLTGGTFFVAKHDTNGNALWARSFESVPAGIDDGVGIAVDTEGNCYVTGEFAIQADFGPVQITGAGAHDAFVAKYDTDGTVLWARALGGTEEDKGYGIAVDAAGNSLVTGSFRDTASFGAFTLTSDGHNDMFLAKLDSTGDVLWVRSVRGTLDESGRSVSVDATGNSYVTGTFGAVVQIGPFTLTSTGEREIFVAKYDQDGNVLWAERTGGSLNDFGLGIAASGNGDAYVTGLFQGRADFGAFTHRSAGDNDIFVAKYTPCGNSVVDPGEECDDGGESARCDVDCTFAECGDELLNTASGEECEGGVSCTACLCDADFESTNPPSFDCQAKCGNGRIDPNEECDGGLACSGCLCDSNFESMVPPSLDCQPLCSNGVCNSGENSCNCPVDCGTPPSGEIPLSTCRDRLDNDCDGNVDCADDDCSSEPICERIPTVSQWGFITMMLLLLIAAKVHYYRWRFID